MDEWSLVVGTIIGPDEQVTNREADERFLDLMEALGVDEATYELAYRCWIKASDHEEPSALPKITQEEFTAFCSVARKLQEGAIQ